MFLFDTNIFLEILLNQKQALACKNALEKVNRDNPGCVASFSIHAIEAIIGGAKKFKLLTDFLESLEQHPLLECYVTTLQEECEISRLAPKLGLDFDDALQYYIARKREMTLVTLDHDFKKIKDITVVAPSEIE